MVNKKEKLASKISINDLRTNNNLKKKPIKSIDNAKEVTKEKMHINKKNDNAVSISKKDTTEKVIAKKRVAQKKILKNDKEPKKRKKLSIKSITDKENAKVDKTKKVAKLKKDDTKIGKEETKRKKQKNKEIKEIKDTVTKNSEKKGLNNFQKIKKGFTIVTEKIKEKTLEDLETSERKEDVRKQEKVLRKTKRKAARKKYLNRFTIPIIIIVLIVLCFMIYSYRKDLKKTLELYAKYSMGEKVTLKDNSIWYVVENSDKSIPTVKLLKEYPIDVNKDGKVDAKDKKKFDSDKKTDFVISNKKNIGYYLDNDFKKTFDKLGGVSKVELLTSKEYVKMRDKMNFGYEWTKANFLAGSKIGEWWINSSQQGKMFVVNTKGSYSMQYSDKSYYVRPVITIDKEKIK